MHLSYDKRELGMEDKLVEDLLNNVIAKARTRGSIGTSLLKDTHLVGFLRGQHPTRDQVKQLLGRSFQLNGITYYISHVGDPGQYLVRGAHVRFSTQRPSDLSIDHCKRGVCDNH